MQHALQVNSAGQAIAEPTLGWQWRRSFALAGQDCLHEWHVTLCLMLALAAVLAPLLVLFGLKSGIVTTMTERLKADPRNLEITLKGNHRLQPSWVDGLRARSDVGFVVPRTRTLAATMDLIGPGGKVLSGIDVLPTAEGDPLLAPGLPVPLGLHDVALSHTAAGRLGVAPGDRIDGVVGRRLDGVQQRIEIPLAVVAVLSEAAFRRDGAFASVPLLVATEDYRDGLAVASLGVDTGAASASQTARSYAGLRLYARSLEDVAPLAADLRAQGFDVLTRAKEIQTVQAIDRTLSFIFLVIATVAATGFLLSMAASIWANVDRKRRDLALLRLVGLKTSALMVFPASQALIVAVGGLLLSALLYTVVSQLFNATLAANLARDEFVCRLYAGHGLLASVLTLGFALAASAFGAYRAAKIDPAESLREL